MDGNEKELFEVNRKMLSYSFSLFEYDGIPIVFVAQDDENELYLCVYGIEYDDEKWAVAKCSINDVELLADRLIDVYGLMQLCQPKYLVTYRNGLGKYDIKEIEQFSDYDLTKPGAMLLVADVADIKESIYEYNLGFSTSMLYDNTVYYSDIILNEYEIMCNAIQYDANDIITKALLEIKDQVFDDLLYYEEEERTKIQGIKASLGDTAGKNADEDEKFNCSYLDEDDEVWAA